MYQDKSTQAVGFNGHRAQYRRLEDMTAYALRERQKYTVFELLLNKKPALAGEANVLRSFAPAFVKKQAQ